MKESVQLFVDQRGQTLRALITEGERVLAAAVLPGPLNSASTLQELVAVLFAKVGRKPDLAHLLIAADQVKLSTYRLQEMPLADGAKIIQRSIMTATGEREPIFRMTRLAPQQDKDVFLAEQIPRATVAHLQQLFAQAHIRLASISTTLQANIAAFAPFRDGILQAHAIFDVSPEAVTATFLSPTEILHHETLAIRDSDRDPEVDDDAGSERVLKRRLFAVLNVIHGLYSQYMLANPLSPVEKVWLCGPGAEIAGLEESLVDAMDIEVASLDLLAGKIEESRSFSPLAGLIGASSQKDYVNFLPAQATKSTQDRRRLLALFAAGLVALLCIAVVGKASYEVFRWERSLARERSEIKRLQAAAAAEQGRVASLRYLKQLGVATPPLSVIFSEIAFRLPREVQLDGINLLQGDEVGTLEVLAVTQHKTPWHNERIFTSLMASLYGVPHLQCSQNPDIAMLRLGKEKLIKLKVSCRLIPPEGEH